MLEEDLPTLKPGEIQEIAHSLRKSASNIYRLLENLLEWSLMQRGIKSSTKESFLLKPKIAGSIELMLDSAHSKDIGINYDVPDDMMISADVHMIETVIRNLVSNAVKFTGNGGKISVKARRMAGSLVEISVTDTGIGMNKDYLDRLFRIDGDTGREGTNGESSNGLGLIICKDFIERNGGKMWVESEEGKGSTFSFSVPSE
jgi:signal transduction histidine kinase